MDRIIIATLVVIATVALGAWWRLRSHSSGPATAVAADSGATMYLTMRRRVLESRPDEIGLAGVAGLEQTWAAVMEMGMDRGATVTVVSFIEGSASIYTSTGGGFIGGGSKPAIRDAAVAFVNVGREVQPTLSASDDVALPRTGETVFYIRKGNQRYRASTSTADLESGPHALAPLWAAAQNVITQYRLDSERR